MSVVAPPEPPSHDELEALIREARARQRRRLLVIAALVAGAAGIGLGVNAVLAGGGANPKQGHGSKPLPVAATSRCRGDQLATSARGGGAYTGHSLVYFTLRNVSSEPCRLRGRSRVELVMRNGRHVAAREQPLRNLTRRSDSPVPVQTVVLRPRGIASFLVIVINQVGRRGPEPQVFCSWSRAILVTPPDGVGAPVGVAYSLSNCGLGVTPVVAGRDRYSFG